MNTFTPDNTYQPSHRMDIARVSEDRLIEILGNGESPSSDNKSNSSWNGVLTINAGTKHEEKCYVAAWDWHGGLKNGNGVSIWAEKEKFLLAWKHLLTG